MPKQHSIELKGRIIGACGAVATLSSIAKAFNVYKNTVLNVIKNC